MPEDSARAIYRELEQRIQGDPEISAALIKAYGITPDAVTIRHVAESLADFFRDRFRLRETRFHSFVFGDGDFGRARNQGRPRP